MEQKLLETSSPSSVLHQILVAKASKHTQQQTVTQQKTKPVAHYQTPTKSYLSRQSNTSAEQSASSRSSGVGVHHEHADEHADDSVRDLNAFLEANKLSSVTKKSLVTVYPPFMADSRPITTHIRDHS